MFTFNLKELIIREFDSIIDPETGFSIWKMELIKDLKVDSEGNVSFIFEPTSYFCPMAEYLLREAYKRIKALEGIKKIEVKVQNYIKGKELQEELTSL